VMLSERYKVTAVSHIPSPYDVDLPFEVLIEDVSNKEKLRTLIKAHDAVFSALPYSFNESIVRIAVEENTHYFDLSEDVPTTQLIQKLSKTSDAIMAPQCGLAPGYIGIIGAHLAKKFTKLRDIELRVGALPRYPNGQLAYSFTWSPAGVVNEYINDAEVIHNGKRKTVSSLDGLENINIEGQEFEAFSTSGGLGTMCETYEGKVDTLNYKTMRYPGHAQLMRFLLYELLLKNDRKLAEKILTEAKPPVQDDVVYIYAVVEGWKNEKLEREEYFKACFPMKIGDKTWRAISWTTAASAVAVVDMVADKLLAQKGFIKQEDIDWEQLIKTRTGSYFSK
jgi:saccharopine dehydrogenase-like NADP-dependent oxidoreductase